MIDLSILFTRKDIDRTETTKWQLFQSFDLPTYWLITVAIGCKSTSVRVKSKAARPTLATVLAFEAGGNRQLSVDSAVPLTAESRMLNSRDVLELVNHCFNDRLLTHQEFAHQPH